MANPRPRPRPDRRFRWADQVTGEGIIPPRPGANLPLDADVDDFYKRSKTDRFSEWRRGNYDWIQGDRLAHISAIVHPKSGSWDPWDLRAPDDNLRIEYTAFEGTDARRQEDETEDETEESREALQLLVDRFKQSGFDQVELVGRDGSHVTMRFTMVDTDGDTQSLLVRADLEEGPQTERSVLQRLSGARHILQRVELRSFEDPDEPTITRIGVSRETRQNARGELDMDGDVVILQDARHGDLGSWLERLAARNKGKPLSERERPPEAVLWSIFYCLFHACLAMAYPQRLAGRGPGGAKAPVPARPETIPRGASRDSKPTDALVHFDLRPSNVVIGEFDQGQNHSTFPIVKVTNFTRAAFPKSAVFNLEEDEERAERYLWALRERGQQDSFLPEQTSEAWDYMPNLAALRSSFVAGNYGANSNIFHIGLIMHQIITGCSPPKPFIPRPFTIPDAEKAGNETGWTYGHALLSQYEDWRIDNDGTVWPSEALRNTIARCMEYLPARRLGFKRLSARIENGLRGVPLNDNDGDDSMDEGDGDMDMDDDEIRQWAEWSLLDAPAQSDPTQSYEEEDPMDLGI